MLDGKPIYIMLENSSVGNVWEKVTVEKDKIVIRTKATHYYQVSRPFQSKGGTVVTLEGTTENIAQGTVTEKYTSSFPLTEIDDLREYTLSKGREEIIINKESDEKLKSLFLYSVLFSPNPDKDGTPESIPPIGTLEMGGLCLKTYQSDLFNNWVNKEWVDGNNGINEVTDVDVSDGKLNLDVS